MPDAECDFGSYLGNEKKESLEAALLYYQYATVYKNKISLLDSNEIDASLGGFPFQSTPYAFKKADPAKSKVSTIKEIKIDQIKTLPPYSAYSFKIIGSLVDTIEKGKEAVLKVSSSEKLTVSLLEETLEGSSLDSQYHTWFTTDKKVQHTFEGNKLKPYFITLVNPTASKAKIYELSLKVVDIPPLKKTGIKTSSVTDDDGSLQKGVANNYSRNNVDNIVSDHVTGLMWQDDADVASISKPYVLAANYANEKFTDTSGDTVVSYCQNLSLGGFDDWKVPTLDQYFSILNLKNIYRAIDETIFKNTALSPTNTDFYWSSTDGLRSSYIIGFYGGVTATFLKNESAHIRCVRRFQ